MKRDFNLLMLLLALLCFSCASSKKTNYFQDIDRERITEELIENYRPITIQPSDILSINVTSLNPQAWSDTSNRDLGYLVDQRGEIVLPLVGTVKAAGLTSTALGEQLRERLLPYLKEPSVVVRILNFKVSVMGDVMKPATYSIASERITVNEAISMAGDLNITGMRKNVMLIREVDGTRSFIPLDLTASNFIRSPYFYLRNNDVLYVQPGKNKYAASTDGVYRSLSLALSALSIVAIIITR